MKKIYILAVALTAFAFSGQAQVDMEDDFDFYNLGDISSQAFHFRTWSGAEGGAEDADVVDTFAASGTQSMLVDGSGVVDMIMLVDENPTTGNYDIQWKMYIPAGKGGYFNMQAALTPAGDAWEQALLGGNVYFNCGGAQGGAGEVSGATDCTAAVATFTYPEDEWFTVTCHYDNDAQTWGMEINGVEQFTGYVYAFGTQTFEGLAGLDFFSVDSNNEYYVDDLKIGPDVTLSNANFDATGFRSAMNNGTLTLKAQESIDSIAIFNMLGQQVYNANVNSTQTSIDMTNMANGTYIVKAIVGGVEGTVKVIR